MLRLVNKYRGSHVSRNWEDGTLKQVALSFSFMKVCGFFWNLEGKQALPS